MVSLSPSSPLSDIPQSSPTPLNTGVGHGSAQPQKRRASPDLSSSGESDADADTTAGVLPPLDLVDPAASALQSDDTSVIWSSPIRTAEDRRRKGRKYAGQKIQERNARKREDEAQHVAEEHEAAANHRKEGFHRALEVLQTYGLKFSDLVAYVFNSENLNREWRWKNFFHSGILPKILNFWASDDCPGSVHDALGFLRVGDRAIDASFTLGLKLRD